MSFINEINKTVTKIGNIAKETYGPLEPLLNNDKPNKLRYPLDVGDAKRYPHTIEFQTWIPDQVALSDIGVIQAGQDGGKVLTNKLVGGIKELAAQAGDAVKDIPIVGSLVRGIENLPNPQFDPLTVNGLEMKVNKNQRWNDRLMDFTRRATMSDQITMYMPNGPWIDRGQNAYNQKSLTEALGNLGAIADVAGSLLKNNELKDVPAESWEMLNGPVGASVIGAAAGALGMDGGTIRDTLLTSMGWALNPQFEMLYNGTDLREFQFEFTMTPRSVDEAQMIRKIIKKFKYHASPAYVSGQGRYIVPPSYFDITFKFNGEDTDWLPQISTCILKSFDVDYSGGLDTWATHADGSPIQVKLTLTFGELEMMHKSLRKKGY